MSTDFSPTSITRAERLDLAERYLDTPEARALAREIDRNEFLREYSAGTGTLHEVWSQCRALKNQRAAIRRKLGRKTDSK